MKHKKSELLLPLDECSREPDEDGVSEYDVRLAISRMPDEFTSEELAREVEQVVANQVFSSLVDKGLAEAFWNPETQAFEFRLKQ